jgi:hypothetical protein
MKNGAAKYKGCSIFYFQHLIEGYFILKTKQQTNNE